MNYPTEEYESYAECDDHFVTRSLPPGLKPFWAVDNISEATNTFSMKTDVYEKTVSGLGIGKISQILTFKWQMGLSLSVLIQRDTGL